MAETRDTAVGAFVAGDLLSAATTNDGPGGLIAKKSRVSNGSGTTSTETIITILNVPVNTARLVVVKAQGMVVATNDCGAQIRLDQDGVQIMRQNLWLRGRSSAPADVAKQYTFHVESEPIVPGAGNHTYDLIVGVDGTAYGTITFSASGPTPNAAGWLAVYDVGPNF